VRLLITATFFDEAAGPTSLVHLGEIGSSLDIWLVPYTRLGVYVHLTLAVWILHTEGPGQGTKSEN
jgi:hypothetical protein